MNNKLIKWVTPASLLEDFHMETLRALADPNHGPRSNDAITRVLLERHKHWKQLVNETGVGLTESSYEDFLYERNLTLYTLYPSKNER